MRQALGELRGRLEGESGSRLLRLTLFSSHARGEAGPGSDVDVLVVIEGLTARERRAAHDLLFQHFVRAGLLARDLAKAFAALQRFREQADYATAVRFDRDSGADEVTRAEQIVAAITKLLGERGIAL